MRARRYGTCRRYCTKEVVLYVDVGRRNQNRLLSIRCPDVWVARYVQDADAVTRSSRAGPGRDVAGSCEVGCLPLFKLFRAVCTLE
jgi:hypothetical protein